jgi:hypothetical protein
MSSWATFKAAQSGHLEVLIYLKENGCSVHHLCIHRAVLNGHLEVFKWLYKNYCYVVKVQKKICSCAAFKGRLEILQFAINSSCKYNKKRLLTMAGTRQILGYVKTIPYSKY